MDTDRLIREYAKFSSLLIPSVTHQINNSMQAVRGALTLAQEDLQDTEELNNYIRMSLTETERVVHLTRLLRRINGLQLEQDKISDLLKLLEDAITISQKHLSKIDIQVVFPPTEDAEILVKDNHLFLAFVMLLISLGQSMPGSQNTTLLISCTRMLGRAEISFSISGIDLSLDIENSVDKTHLGFIRSLLMEIGGELTANYYPNQTNILVQIPFTNSQ